MKLLWLSLLALLMTAVVAGSAPADPGPTDWYAITAGDGAVLGHGSRETRSGPTGRIVVETQDLSLREPGSPAIRILGVTTSRQDLDGRTLSMSAVSRTGASTTVSEATISGDRAVIVRRTGADRRTVTVTLPPGVRFDSGEGLLATWDPSRTPRLTFDAFNLDAMLVERMVIEPAPEADSPPAALVLLRRRYEDGTLRGVARMTLGPDRRVRSVTQALFGTRITVSLTDRETALKPHAPYRVLAGAMTKSPFRIPPSAAGGHIRYRFGFEDGMVFDLPRTGEQGVRGPGEEAIVDICEGCGPGLPTDAAYLADALKSTVWLQSDHPRLRALAAPVAAQRISDSRKMKMLIQRARPFLGRMDFTGHYSALETMSRRAGDCTEAAVLLAALGRAAGIPTRVVNGLVYSREPYHGVSNVFMPHSWTLAYVDGAWRSFDLALEQFDATHIALTVGDGDARSISSAAQLASLLRWRDLAEVRTRPAS